MKVLCVAAHPDDEVIGVGGTLAKHAAAGDEVDVLLLSDGTMARYETETEAARNRRAERRAEAQTAGDVLGVSDVTVLDYWGNQLDDVALIDVIRDVEAKIDAFRPNVVYTHHYGDLNVDHQLIAQAVRTATRPMVDSPVDRLLAFETLSVSEWGMPSVDNAFHRRRSSISASTWTERWRPSTPTRARCVTGHIRVVRKRSGTTPHSGGTSPECLRPNRSS